MKQKRKIVTGLLAGLLGGATGAAVVALASEIPFIDGALRALGWWDLLLLLPMLLLVIFAHEVGHLLGGMVKGMQFLLLVVGPFQLTRGQGGQGTQSRLIFSWNLNPATYGGLAAAIPARERSLVPQLRWLVLGGPLTSLLLGIVALGVAGWLPRHPGAILTMIGLLSLAIFLATAIPFRAGGMQSDGWQLIELARGGAGVIERQLIIEVMGRSLSGQRPRDWDPAMVARLETLESREALRAIAARSQALYHYWDSADQPRVEALAGWLDQHLEDYPDGFRQGIHLELALLCLESGRLDDCRRHVSSSRGGVVDPARRGLLAATLARNEGRNDEARLAISEARRALPRGMDPGINCFTADQLDRLEAALGGDQRT